MQLQTPHCSCPSSVLWDHTARQFGSPLHITAAVKRLRQEDPGHVNELDCFRRGDIGPYSVYPEVGIHIVATITKKITLCWTVLPNQCILNRHSAKWMAWWCLPYMSSPSIIWAVLCEKKVSRAGASNYIPYYLWDGITCHSLWHLLLAPYSLVDPICKMSCIADFGKSVCQTIYLT